MKNKFTESTIEKLANKYFEYTGKSPEYSFFGWLDSIGINPNEADLLKLYKDNDYWDEL